MTNPHLVYGLLLAVDVERYSRRNAWEQLNVQRYLEEALQVAATGAGLDRARWNRQPRGDGELAVMPEVTDIPYAVGAFTHGLEVALAEVNYDRPLEERLRVRAAFHYGTLTSGPFGPAGDAPIVVSRLLDSAALRKALAMRRERDLALIVSDSLYEDIVSTGFCALDATSFEPMRTSVKGIGYRGQIYTGEKHVPSSVEEENGATVLAFPPRRTDAAPDLGWAHDLQSVVASGVWAVPGRSRRRRPAEPLR